GLGKRAPESMTELLASKDRHAAGKTAPANALTLCWVRYPDFPWQADSQLSTGEDRIYASWPHQG
ncbi:MAG: hypothetical protein KC561_02220, partial [Myxococcales bacterium]|nr:hypothetical protein [Myxococcales bacterium]